MASRKLPPLNGATGRPRCACLPGTRCSDSPLRHQRATCRRMPRDPAAAIDEHVSGPARGASRGTGSGRATLRDDAELARQRREEDGNVVDALVVRHEEVGACRGIEPLEARDARRRRRSWPGSATTKRAHTRARSGRAGRTGSSTSDTCRGRSCRPRSRGSGRRRSATSGTAGCARYGAASCLTAATARAAGGAHRLCLAAARRRPRDVPVPAPVAAGAAARSSWSPAAPRLRRARRVDEAAEDHLAGGGLQHAGDDDVDGLADHRRALSTTTIVPSSR